MERLLWAYCDIDSVLKGVRKWLMVGLVLGTLTACNLPALNPDVLPSLPQVAISDPSAAGDGAVEADTPPEGESGGAQSDAFPTDLVGTPNDSLTESIGAGSSPANPQVATTLPPPGTTAQPSASSPISAATSASGVASTPTTASAVVPIVTHTNTFIPTATSTSVPAATATPVPPPTSTPIPPPTLAPDPGFTSYDNNGEMLALVNQARCAQGMSALTLNNALINAASAHSQDMALNNFFSHTGLNGSDPGARISAQGYAWATYGENIAAGSDTSSQTFDLWWNSPGHYANMMNPAFREMGLGHAFRAGSQWGHYWTQVFGSQGQAANPCA